MSHLVFLMHGHLGSPRGLENLAEALRVSSKNVRVHVAQSNAEAFLSTTDGVEAGGRRLADEITRVAREHAGTAKYISLIGVSLGGIYCRWAVRLLAEHETERVAGLIPFAFITLASPHIGVSHSASLHILAAVHLAWHTGADKTAGQLLGLDDDYEALWEMTAPPFLTALRLFKHRALFANLINDARVDYCSAALLLSPFCELHRADALADKRLEIIGAYDVADYPQSPSHAAKPYATGAHLSDKQKAMMAALRTVQFTNVDVRLDGTLAAQMFGHSCIQGAFVHYGLPGTQCINRIVNFVTQDTDEEEE